jgi:hypothetical protein
MHHVIWWCSLYFDLYIESGLARKADKRWMGMVSVIHPVSFTGTLVCAAAFVLVVSYANTEYIANKAAAFGYHVATVWFVEIMQVLLPLVAHIGDLVLCRQALKVMHRIISYEDQWQPTLLTWFKLLYFVIVSPIVVMVMCLASPSMLALKTVCPTAVRINHQPSTAHLLSMLL